MSRLAMIEVSCHGATSGVIRSGHELRLTAGMKKGSDPTGSDPNFAANSGPAGMLLKKGSDPNFAANSGPAGMLLKKGSDPSFAANSGSAGMLPKKGSDPVGSDPNFTPFSSAGILIGCGLFQGQEFDCKPMVDTLTRAPAGFTPNGGVGDWPG